MAEIVLTEKEQGMFNEYYKRFFSQFIKISRDYFKVKYNPESDTSYNFYSASVDSFLFSIRTFKTEETDTLERERLFIGYVCRNIKFYIMNYINNKKIQRFYNTTVSYDASDEMYIHIENCYTTNKDAKIIENNIDMELKIADYVRKADISELGLSRPQLTYILKLMFTGDNFKYLQSTDTEGKTISSKVYTNFIKHIFEQYLKETSVDKSRFNITCFKAFKMKVYPIIKKFLALEKELYEKNKI